MSQPNSPHYAERRKRLIENFGDGPLLIRGAAAPFSLRYLTGIKEPRAALLLSREGIRVERGTPGPDYVLGRTAGQVLFLPRSDPRAAQWGEDAEVTLDQVSAGDFGVEAVLDEGSLRSTLDRALHNSRYLYHVQNQLPSMIGAAEPGMELLSRIRERFVGLELRDATPAVHEMRRLKDDHEIAAIERSAAITSEGLKQLSRRIRPGLGENELEAELTQVYRSRGAVHAFDPIVAAGPNALQLHYTRNDGTLEAGQLLLVDTGACLDGYHSDVTRTLPVDGRFTARQREVYEVVLAAQLQAIERCRPGETLSSVHAAAFRVIDDAGFGPAFIHGTSHHLGLETHDVGDVRLELKPGAVITVEPGVYLADEGLGIRIEDDVLITDQGPRLLSPGIPRSVDEIERALAAAQERP